MTKYITINNKKGGTGKTSVSCMLAVYFSKFGKTCLIDSDESGNATRRFTEEIKEQAELTRLFRRQEVIPMFVKENLDLLAGTAELELVNAELIQRMNNTLIFSSYLRKYDTFKNYDYVVIDTRNDSNIITNNMLAASDLVLGVSDPSADGFEALLGLKTHIDYLQKELVDVFTGKSYVRATVRFVGNQIAHNTDVSRQFKELIATNKTFLGYFQDRTAFDEASLQRISLLDLLEQEKYQQKKYQEFKKQTYMLLKEIKKCVDVL
ncbi:ParA family protein [Enterococcus faecalis]|uniref:ParA family protein n=1 Tax=Enterococcus faecalis TaxID=1351 RepID=UPI001A978F49|nr:ParA family protein [Enterococcus faecalis]MBO1137332.1 ParA family protein [Enterococcus faecalis]